MDDIDKKILDLLTEDARMSVKNIASRVCLTSPAISERIKRMEKNGAIAKYTIVLGDEMKKAHINALVSISLAEKDRDLFFETLRKFENVRRCHHVTGSYSYIMRVDCTNMAELETIITEFQKVGQTSTQIVLSTPLDRTNNVGMML